MKFMRVVIALLAILAQPALAADFVLPDGSAFRSIDPPAKWLNTKPLGKEDVRLMSAKQLTEYCSNLLGYREDKGCAVPISGPLGHYCSISISEALPEAVRKIVLVHETAHCRGWGKDHPMTGPERAISLPDWPDKPKSWFDARWPD